MSGPEEELAAKVGLIFDGRPADQVISVCVNMIVNCVLQNEGRRPVAMEKVEWIYHQTMNTLLEFYDPTTGRRRSVVPFNQVISPEPLKNGTRFPGIGGKNGRA